jgi:iron complex outermembrane receptor protein
MRQTSLALALSVVFVTSIQAETLPEFVGETIVVTATRMPLADVDAPFASEVHTRSMIAGSGAASLVDYLAQHTSVQVMPSYGNTFTPRIDMRGYGIGDGYQNIVVSLDGRRLNNIDQVPQLVGAIPLADIERIEITKGSGSVCSVMALLQARFRFTPARIKAFHSSRPPAAMVRWPER